MQATPWGSLKSASPLRVRTERSSQRCTLPSKRRSATPRCYHAEQGYLGKKCDSDHAVVSATIVGRAVNERHA